MKPFQTEKINCTLLMFALTWIVTVGSPAALAQSCVTVPPVPTECYDQISVQSGQFGWNWPPKGAILYCPDGVPTGAAYYYLRNNKCPAKPKCLECERLAALAAGHVQAGGPIELASGDTYITETDVSLPGLGGGLTLSRTWNSILFDGVAQLGMFGFRWASNFEESIYISGNGLLQYLRGDGGIWQFAYSGGQPNGNLYVPVSPANEAVTLTQTQTNWMIQFQNGQQRTFDLTSGKLLSVADRNGNATTLSYDASYRLVKVTDPASRHLYFTYASPSSFLVTGITSDFGVSLSYAYDQLGRLTQVTKPDTTTVSFQYDTNGYVTAVLDNNGKVLESHTYDSSGRGLTSSRAGGAEGITVSYPQPQSYGGQFLEP
jgi:YD repeat-containing protein